jgi:hypothetical protein
MNLSESVYTKDTPVLGGGGGVRTQFRKSIGFGTSWMLGAAGYPRAQRRYIFNWFRKRYVKHLRCQFTLSNPYFTLPKDKTEQIIDHWLELDGATVLLTAFNFTPDGLNWVTDSQRAQILNHPFAKGDSAKAGKLAISLGRHADSEVMLKEQKAFLERQLATVEKYKGNPRVMIERDNEFDWMPIHPFPAEKQPYDLAAFSTSIGLIPAQGASDACTGQLDAFIEGLGFSLYKKKTAHPYHGWNGERTTQFSLNLPSGEPYDVTEVNASSLIPEYPTEVSRVLLDAAARRPEVIYFHTHALCNQGFQRRDTRECYDQFKNPENALNWVAGKVPLHEGACVLNPEVDSIVSSFGKLVTMGEHPTAVSF